MKQWLRQAVPHPLDMDGERDFLLRGRVGRNPAGFDGLLYWSYVPDEHARRIPAIARSRPSGFHERLMHFIDLEYFQPQEKQRGYRHDLSGKPPIDLVPREPSDPRYTRAGVLPLRIEHCYQELVEAIRPEQMHAPTTRHSSRKARATYWAGYLAHYVADNTQPHHATIDYKSQSYFANRRKAPNVHGEIEYRMRRRRGEGVPRAS